jgi:hypothetical protein
MNTGIPHVFGLTAQWSSAKDFHVWIHLLEISSYVFGVHRHGEHVLTL